MPKGSHYNTVYFFKIYAHAFKKVLFTNIQEPQNILKISLILMKNTNFKDK